MKQKGRKAKGKKDIDESCCTLDAVVSLDSRGQILLPKDIRERAGLESGERLALILQEKDGEVCCMYLVKADSCIEDFVPPG